MMLTIAFEKELGAHRGEFVEGVGGYKVEKPLPPSLSRKARRRDLVRRIREIWYIKGPGDWKLEVDRIGLWERLAGRFRGNRPHTDAESRRYWEARGGVGYEHEAFSSEWLEPARNVFQGLWKRLSAEGVDTVLEVGCGPGRNLTLMQEFSVPRILGLDFSYSQLEKARDRGFRVGQATAKVLPVRDKCVDVVMFVQVLLHVPPPIGPVLEEAVRAARRFVVLLEQQYDDVGSASAPTEVPHCFRHNFVEHMKRVAPHAELIQLKGGQPGVRLFRL